MSFLVPYLFVLLISLEELVGLIEVCFHLFFDANLGILCLFLMLLGLLLTCLFFLDILCNMYSGFSY